MMFILLSKFDKWSIFKVYMGGTNILSLGILGGFFSGIIAPRPAGPYPDISLAGKNPMSVALTERHHKSQDNYLLGKISLLNVYVLDARNNAVWLLSKKQKISPIKNRDSQLLSAEYVSIRIIFQNWQIKLIFISILLQKTETSLAMILDILELVI